MLFADDSLEKCRKIGLAFDNFDRFVFHNGAGKDEEPIVLFTDDSLEKCRKILEVRKLEQRKYMDVCVPSSVDENSGYHMDCYGRFTALVKPDREYLATLNKEQKKVSSTKSRKVIEVLNRLGHSISYSAVEEIEIKLTFEGTKENCLIPQQMTMDSEAGVGLAFDNLNCFVFHDGAGKDEEPIVLFADDSLEKCRKILEVRKLEKRKYMDVCVPSFVDENSGYHMDCYRRFTALVKPDREYLATLNKELKKV